MAKLCNACDGPVCFDCGGCIREGECSCIETKVEARVQERLQSAREAVEALLAEWFVATEAGYGEAERDLYHATHWKKLREAVGARRFCDTCGNYYTGEHLCDGDDIVPNDIPAEGWESYQVGRN